MGIFEKVNKMWRKLFIVGSVVAAVSIPVYQKYDSIQMNNDIDNDNKVKVIETKVIGTKVKVIETLESEEIYNSIEIIDDNNPNLFYGTSDNFNTKSINSKETPKIKPVLAEEKSILFQDHTIKNNSTINKSEITITIDQCVLNEVLIDNSGATVQDLINISYKDTVKNTVKNTVSLKGVNPREAYHASKKGIGGKRIIKVDPKNKSRYIGVNLLDALINTAGRNTSLYQEDDSLDAKIIESTARTLENDLNNRFGKHYSFTVETKSCESKTGDGLEKDFGKLGENYGKLKEDIGEEIIIVSYAPITSIKQEIPAVINEPVNEHVNGPVIAATITTSIPGSAEVTDSLNLNGSSNLVDYPELSESKSTINNFDNGQNGGCIAGKNPLNNSKNRKTPTIPLSGLGLVVALSYIGLRKKENIKQEITEKASMLFSSANAANEINSVKQNYSAGLNRIAEQFESEYAEKVAAILTNKSLTYETRAFKIANYIENNSQYMTINELKNIEKVIVAATQSNYARRTEDVTVLLASLSFTLDAIIEEKIVEKQNDSCENSLYAQLSRGSKEKARELALSMSSVQLTNERKRITDNQKDQLTQYEEIFFEEMLYVKELETLALKRSVHKHEEIRLNLLKNNYQEAFQSMLNMTVAEIKQLDRETDYSSLTAETKTKVEEAFDTAAKYARAKYGDDSVKGLNKIVEARKQADYNKMPLQLIVNKNYRSNNESTNNKNETNDNGQNTAVNKAA